MADYVLTQTGEQVQDDLNLAETAYQKDNAGIPETDLSQPVRAKLNAGNTAYQKPTGGVPSTDMTVEVQQSLQKADEAAPQATTYNKTEVDSLLNQKQNNLTFDATPVENSEHPVTSGGIYTSEQGIRQSVTEVSGRVSAETQRAQGAEGTLQSNINAEETRAKAAERQNASDIDAIEAKIPNAASSSNQLADKQFVNSTAATNTATYRGSYNLVSDLHLAVTASRSAIAAALPGSIETADNNDYCFVQVPTAASTPAVIARVERYKYNGSAWAFEYELNNSGFTAAQWNAINSAITSGLVAKLAALPTNAELTTLLNGKQAVIADLSTIRNGASAGATAYQKPSGGIPSTDMTSAVQQALTKANAAAPQSTTYTKTEVDSVMNDLGTRLLFAERSFGKYSNTSTFALSQKESGKYVNVNGTTTSASGYGISNSFTLKAGDILLVPSAQAVPAAVSVVARIVTRTFDKVIGYTYIYRSDYPELPVTATADYDASLVYVAVYEETSSGPVLTGWTRNGTTYAQLPATREVTESYYEPLVKQSVSAMPSTGYYIYLCPSAMTVVISGLTATVAGGQCIIVGWGIFKNICSNFVGAPGQAVIAQAFAQLQSEIDGVKAQFDNLGETKAICIDSENLPKVCGEALVIEGAGAPSVVPMFVGQRYHDTTNRKVYEAFAVTNSTADWTLLN